MIKSPPNGYQYQCPTLGILHTSNVQINPLPAVGSTVRVYEHVPTEDREKRKTGKNMKYVPADSYLDAFGEPLLFKVEEYSEGPENVLSKGNKVKLHPLKKGCVCDSLIRTVLVATGHFKLVPIEDVAVGNKGGALYEET